MKSKKAEHTKPYAAAQQDGAKPHAFDRAD
jgi:hypothetical protein